MKLSASWRRGEAGRRRAGERERRLGGVRSRRFSAGRDGLWPDRSGRHERRGESGDEGPAEQGVSEGRLLRRVDRFPGIESSKDFCKEL